MRVFFDIGLSLIRRPQRKSRRFAHFEVGRGFAEKESTRDLGKQLASATMRDFVCAQLADGE